MASGCLPWSPLAGGLLAGGLEQAEVGSRRARKQVSADQQAQVDQYEALCRDLGAEPAVVALAWLLHNPVVTAPVIGPRTVAQLEGAVKRSVVSSGCETLAGWTRSGRGREIRRRKPTPGDLPPGRWRTIDHADQQSYGVRTTWPAHPPIRRRRSHLHRREAIEGFLMALPWIDRFSPVHRRADHGGAALGLHRLGHHHSAQVRGFGELGLDFHRG